MTVKKFFRAFCAGVHVRFERSWPFLRYFLAAVFGVVLGVVITILTNKSVTFGIIACFAGLVLGIASLRTFDRCKEVVEYAEKYDLDMEAAWKKKYNEENEYDCW